MFYLRAQMGVPSFLNKDCGQPPNVRRLALSSSYSLVAFLDKVLPPSFQLPEPCPVRVKGRWCPLLCFALSLADRAGNGGIDARLGPSRWERKGSSNWLATCCCESVNGL